jgi:hypothetical protein
MTVKEYPLVRYSQEKNGDIILAEFPANLKIDLAVAREIVADRLDFANEKKHYVVIDVSNVREITVEAKKYMQRPDPGLKNILGAAFIGTNPISALLANIFVKTRKNFQAKFFTDKGDAYDWIIKHRRKVKGKMSLPIV